MFLLLSFLSAPAEAGPGPRYSPMIRVVLSAESPSEDIILGASSGNSTAVYDLCATGRYDAHVAAFSIQNCLAGTDFDSDCSDFGEEPGVDAVISNMTATYESVYGYTTTSTTTIADGVAVFDGIDDMWVPRCVDGTAPLEISVDTNFTEEYVNAPGDRIQTNWVVDEHFSAGQLVTYRSITRATRSVVAQPQEFHVTEVAYTLASYSPSEDVVAGRNNVLTYHATVNSRGYITQDEIVYKIETTWLDPLTAAQNTCAEMGTDDVWDVYNTLDLSYSIDEEGVWQFYAQSGLLCTDSPDEQIGYAQLVATVEMAAGTTNTFSVTVDSTGFSVGEENDSMRVSVAQWEEVAFLGMEGGIVWRDDAYAAAFTDQLLYNNAQGNTLEIFP